MWSIDVTKILDLIFSTAYAWNLNLISKFLVTLLGPEGAKVLSETEVLRTVIRLISVDKLRISTVI